MLATENIREEFSFCILKSHMLLVEKKVFSLFFYFLCFLKEIFFNDRSLVFVLDYSVCLQAWLFFVGGTMVLQYTITPFFLGGIVK